MGIYFDSISQVRFNLKITEKNGIMWTVKTSRGIGL